jgi:hypothetical protein
MKFYKEHHLANKLVEVRGGKNITNAQLVDGSWVDNGQKGVFALQHIRKGEVLAPYLGHFHRRVAGEGVSFASAYIMQVSPDSFVDAEHVKLDIGYMASGGRALKSAHPCAPNYARYVNSIHPGIPFQTEAWEYNCEFKGDDHGFEEVWLVASKQGLAPWGRVDCGLWDYL